MYLSSRKTDMRNKKYRKNIFKSFAILFTLVLVLAVSAGCGKTIGTDNTQKEVNTGAEKKASGKEKKKDSKGKEEKPAEGDNKAVDSGTNNADTGGGASAGTEQGQNTNGGSPQGGQNTPAWQPSYEPETNPPAPPAPAYLIYITVDAGPYGGVQASTAVGFNYQPSVYDALCSSGVSISGDAYYIRAINGLAEKQHGPTSGWMYTVNGVTVMRACGDCYLNNGDNVYWHYVDGY